MANTGDSRKSLSRVILRFARLGLIPFPFSFAVADLAWRIVTRIMQGPPPDFVPVEAGEIIEQVALPFVVGFLQFAWGMPSVIILDARNCGFRWYVAVGVVSSILLSLGVTALQGAPHPGETRGWMFCHTYLFLGIPVFLGYLLAWVTRRRTDS
jgi:hypothetical protein